MLNKLLMRELRSIAKSLYLKHGFSVVKVKNEEIRGVYIENNLMVKENLF